MKQNQIKDLPRLDTENFENIFNIYQDDKGMYFYNLLQSVVFPQNLPANLFTSYTIRYGDSWPFISYKTLNSPNLWWIIILANGIIDPTQLPPPGTVIRVPVLSVVREILTQIGRS